MVRSKFFQTSKALFHENPLNLPRKPAVPEIPRRQRGIPSRRPIKSVQNIIAVSSAKGGVGKSTIAVNLAIAFAQQGFRSGVLDTDIFGPSIPTLMNLTNHEAKVNAQNNMLLPLSNHGIKSMSMGYLLPSESAPVVWRGLMVMKALQQLLHEVDWSPGLDILVLDLPPGTGDTQLTITQQITLDGAVVVSTPQDVALKDAIKGVQMFNKVNVTTLGMVQNMNMFTCPRCQTETPIFGRSNKLRSFCKEQGVDVLADLPLDSKICEDADEGLPTVAKDPHSRAGKIFSQLASQISTKIGLVKSTT